MVRITCQCGHDDDMDRFCRTTVRGDLPAGQFQCPACGVAWKRKESGYKVLRAGSETMILAEKVEIVAVEASL